MSKNILPYLEFVPNQILKASDLNNMQKKIAQDIQASASDAPAGYEPQVYTEEIVLNESTTIQIEMVSGQKFFKIFNCTPTKEQFISSTIRLTLAETFDMPISPRETSISSNDDESLIIDHAWGLVVCHKAGAQVEFADSVITFPETGIYIQCDSLHDGTHATITYTIYNLLPLESNSTVYKKVLKQEILELSYLDFTKGSNGGEPPIAIVAIQNFSSKEEFEESMKNYTTVEVSWYSPTAADSINGNIYTCSIEPMDSDGKEVYFFGNSLMIGAESSEEPFGGILGWDENTSDGPVLIIGDLENSHLDASEHMVSITLLADEGYKIKNELLDLPMGTISEMVTELVEFSDVVYNPLADLVPGNTDYICTKIRDTIFTVDELQKMSCSVPEIGMSFTFDNVIEMWNNDDSTCYVNYEVGAGFIQVKTTNYHIVDISSLGMGMEQLPLQFPETGMYLLGTEQDWPVDIYWIYPKTTNVNYVQADWEQNNSSKADFIKNRPFYKDGSYERFIISKANCQLTYDSQEGLYRGIIEDAAFLKMWESKNWDSINIYTPTSTQNNLKLGSLMGIVEFVGSQSPNADAPIALQRYVGADFCNIFYYDDTYSSDTITVELSVSFNVATYKTLDVNCLPPIPWEKLDNPLIGEVTAGDVIFTTTLSNGRSTSSEISFMGLNLNFKKFVEGMNYILELDGVHFLTTAFYDNSRQRMGLAIYSLTSDELIGQIDSAYGGVLQIKTEYLDLNKTSWPMIISHYEDAIIKLDNKYLNDNIKLPEVTTEQEGYILKVVNGKWTAVAP